MAFKLAFRVALFFDADRAKMLKTMKDSMTREASWCMALP
jgi:hypothetical protein